MKDEGSDQLDIVTSEFIYVICKKSDGKTYYRKYFKHGNSGCYRCVKPNFSKVVKSLSKFILNASIEGHDVYEVVDEKLKKRFEIDDWDGWTEYLQLDDQLKLYE